MNPQTRMTAADWTKAHARKGPSREPGKGRSKYGAVKTEIDGITFDSKREAQRYAELKQLERAGLISGLKLQHRIALAGRDGPLRGKSGRQLFYVADFAYRDEDGRAVVEDAKGFATRAYALKKAILAAQGINVVEV